MGEGYENVFISVFNRTGGESQVKRKNKHRARGNQTENVIIDNHKYMSAYTKYKCAHRSKCRPTKYSAKTHTSKTKRIPSKKNVESKLQNNNDNKK